MSVDQRIIDMQFNNKEFEKNTAQTMSTLDRLKKGLNLDKSAKSLAALDSQGKKFSLAGISNGVETVSQRFTTLGIIGVTALQNITNSAINAGKKLLSSLTIDPVKSGLDEYETKMNAITTIMTNTKSKGTTLDDVNVALAELNEYADKTIYNFAEMTRNIGTFTAAGVTLDASTSAIKGIANLAAGSGSTAAQASTAMYQLSQAMAAGSVKLQDWNSVVNAGMGGELFQNALKASAKEMGIFVDESMPFRETLKSGWITADVLTKTLAGFSTNEDLVAAATEVKTLTQLIGVLQESVQSGWSVSWENIIGNKEQATKTLTAISNGFNELIGPGVDARNAMLSFWNANGGRNAMIHALNNSFKGLMSILDPIRSAFREIFPRTTGEQLVAISKAIQRFTSKLYLTKETSDNLKMTFKGLFAILDIGLTIFKSLVKNVLKIVGTFVHFDGTLLQLTANIGAFLTGVSITVRNMDVFKTAGEAVIAVLQVLAMVVYVVYKTIVDTLGSINFSKYFDIDKIADGFFKAVNKIKESLASLNKVKVKNPFFFLMSVKEKISGPTKFIVGIFKKIGSVLIGFKNLVVGAFKGRSFEDAMEIIKTGLFSGGFVVILNGIRKMMKGTRGFLDELTKVFTEVKGVLKAYQNELNSKALLNIAIAVGILTASFLLMTTIDPAKMTAVTIAMGAMFGGLVASMAIMGKLIGTKNTASVIGLSFALVGLSVAVLIMTGAMRSLSSIKPMDLVNGVLAIAVLTKVLTSAAEEMSKASADMAKKSLGLIAFAGAITVMVKAIEKIGKLNLKELIQGVIGIIVIVKLLIKFLKDGDVTKMSTSAGMGMLALAAGIYVIAHALEKMGSLSLETIAKGLGALSVSLYILGDFVNRLAENDNLKEVGKMMRKISVALVILALAMKIIGSMSPAELAKALVGIAVAMGSLVVALKYMPKDVKEKAAAILTLSAALVVMSVAMKILGSMSLKQIAKATIAVALALGILVIAANSMTGSGAGAAAMIVMAIALNLLVIPIAALGALGWGVILAGIGGLAIALGVLGLAALILTPLVPIILMLGVGIAAMGLGAALAGLGLTALAAGLVALAAGGATTVAMLIMLIDVFANGIVLVLQKVGEGLVALIGVIGNSAVDIAEAFLKIGLAILVALGKLIPPVLDVFGELMLGLIELAIKYVPDMALATLKLILGIIETITVSIPLIVDAAVEFITAFLEGVGSMAVGIIDAAWNMMITFINGLADCIDENTPELIKAIEKLFDSVINAAKLVIGTFVGDFLKKGKELVGGLIDGIKEKITDVEDKVKEIGKKALDALKNIIPDFANVGIDIVSGLLGGIKGKAGEVVDGLKDVGKDALNGIKGFFKIKSPSRVMQWIGKMMDVGFADGLSLNSMLPEEAALDVGKDTGDALTDGAEEAIVEGTPKVASAAGGMATKAAESMLDVFNKYLTERKNLGDLTLKEELSEWEKFQTKYKEGTDERIAADKEVYRIKSEMLNGMTTIEENYHSGMAKLREDYIKDTEAVTKAYDDALKSRAASIYSAYGLFDKLEGPQFDDEGNLIFIDGKELSDNLDGQVNALKEWRTNIDNLSERGIGTDLMKELTEMGPDASDKIKALNNLTEPELQKYVDLWTEKHQLARWQATEELIGLKKDTKAQILEITKATGPAVEELKNVWMTQMGDLTGKNHEELLILKKDFNVEVTALKNDTETLFTSLKANIEAMDWESTGRHVASGMAAGVTKATPKVEAAVSTMAARSLQAANRTLDINSPSRKFLKVGEFSVMGLVNGLKDRANKVGKAGSELGVNAINSLKGTLANISNTLGSDMDLSPVIRPVVDLSDVKSKSSMANKMFNGIEISASSLNASKIRLGGVEADSPTTALDKGVSFVQNNYSPKSLTRLEIYRNTRNQLSAMKGVVN